MTLGSKFKGNDRLGGSQIHSGVVSYNKIYCLQSSDDL